MTARPPLDYEPNLDWLLEPPGKTFTIGPERGRQPGTTASTTAVYRGATGDVLRLVGYERGVARAGLHVEDGVVRNVFVAPEARRQGWATRLLRAAEGVVGERLHHSKCRSLAGQWWIESLERQPKNGRKTA